MIDSITIVETNPVFFVQELFKAFEQGYYPDVNTNEGSMGCVNGLYDIRLFAKDVPYAPLEEETSVHMIASYDRHEWLHEMYRYYRHGFKPCIDTLSWDMLLMKCIAMVDMTYDVSSKKEIMEMEWEELKEFGRKIGAEFNRKREVFEKNIIDVLNHRRSLVGQAGLK